MLQSLRDHDSRENMHAIFTPLSLFGLFSVLAALVSYALEDRSSWYILGFAGACALSSVYGFLQGAWPFGVIEIAWTAVALRRWWKTVHGITPFA
jgi:hypothetical protein